MDTGLLSVVVVVLVVAGVAAMVWWNRRARADAGGGPPAAPADAHAIAASLHGVYQASAYPRDLLPHAAFERGVALLARDAHGPDELMQYAAGANPMLACMALEALARRRPGGVADHQLLALVNMDFRWPRYFLLRALQAGASGPLAGEVVVRLDETWNEPVPRMMLREFLADRVRAGETLALGDRLGALPRARLEEVTTVLEGLEDAAVAPMLDTLRRVRAASVDLVELATFGRVWTDEELDGDEVVLDAVRQAAGRLEAELRKRPARSMIVVGEPGVGKSTVVRELARRLRPERWLVLEATAADVIAGQVYIGQIEERVKKLVAAVAGRPVLVVVPNVHELVWTGTHRFSPTGLLDLILPHVERGAVTFVGETTPRAWQSMAQARPKLRSLLGIYRVNPLDAEASLDLARQWLGRRQAWTPSASSRSPSCCWTSSRRRAWSSGTCSSRCSTPAVSPTGAAIPRTSVTR